MPKKTQEHTNEELDELVHQAKSEEAAAINNAGREVQLEYLSEDHE